jgi:hypothetical protein
MSAVYFIAIILLAVGLIQMSGHLAAIRRTLSDIHSLLTTIEERSKFLVDSLADIDEQVDDIADLTRTYRKYNTFPLGPLDRPLIGSESEYDNRPG